MAKKKIVKKKVSKVMPKKNGMFVKKEIIMSLIWIAVLIAAGTILSGTSYMTPVLVVVVVGFIGSLIVFNYEK
jgi:hypothetical protein